jgi:DNA repair protein SbcD/Mre11
MRLLHTSDWHLGRTLHGVDLSEHQAAVLAQIVAIARDREVDAVVIAGDVYDRTVPNVDAVRLLDSTLAQLVEIAPVVLIPGNHDSATRLGFAAGLLTGGLHICANVEALTRPVVITDEHGEVAIYGMQYLEPESFRGPLADDSQEPLPRSHQAVSQAAMNRVRADLARRQTGTRAVVVAHEFVTGGVPSDSERDLQVGGVDNVSSDIFAGIHYVALGHLHGPQQVRSPGNDLQPQDFVGSTVIRYSGSPLRYSFSEAEQNKSVTLVEIGAKGVESTEQVDLVQPRAMARLLGPIDELLQNTANVDDWVSVTVTDSVYPDDLQARVRAHFPHVLEIKHMPPTRTRDGVAVSAQRERTPLELMADFVEYVSGVAPDAAQRALLAAAYEAVLANQRSD